MAVLIPIVEGLLSAGVAAGTAVGLSTAAAFFVSVAVLNIAAVAAIGAAIDYLKPDLPNADSYSGAKLQTTKNNYNPVPIVYGENKLAGNIIFQQTNGVISGATNKDYWAVHVIADGEINGYLAMYANENAMTEVSAGIYTNTYTHVKVYNTSGESGIYLDDVYFATNSAGDTALGAALSLTNIFIPPSIAFFTVHQKYDVTNHNSLHNLIPIIEGKKILSILGDSEIGAGEEESIIFNYVDIEINSIIAYNSYAFTIQSPAYTVHFIFNGSTYTKTFLYTSVSSYQYSNITQPFIVALNTLIKSSIPSGVYWNGQSLSSQSSLPTDIDVWVTESDLITISTQDIVITSEYQLAIGLKLSSQNPAEQILDILLNYLNISLESIDLASFYNARIKSESYGYTSNIVFNSTTNMQAAIQAILATFRGQIAYSEGQWKLKLDEKNQPICKTLTEDDLISNSLNISMRGFNDIANTATVKYINPNDEYLSAEATVYDNDLITLDGQTIEKTIDILGCTNSTQAAKLAEITLNTLRYTEDDNGTRIKQTPLIISFATTIKNADLEVGDIVGIEHSIFDRIRKFNILSVESDQGGSIKIGAMEYCNTHYKNSSGTDLI